MRAYPSYRHDHIDRMPYRLFVKLCPPLGELAQPDAHDEIEQARAKVQSMRAWKAERARRFGA